MQKSDDLKLISIGLTDTDILKGISLDDLETKCLYVISIVRGKLWISKDSLNGDVIEEKKSKLYDKEDELYIYFKSTSGNHWVKIIDAY